MQVAADCWSLSWASCCCSHRFFKKHCCVISDPVLVYILRASLAQKHIVYMECVFGGLSVFFFSSVLLVASLCV